MILSCWVDDVILGVMVLSIITGVLRGFMKEAISIVVWIGGLWLAFYYSPEIAKILQTYIHDKTVCMIISFLLILIGTLLFGAIFNACLSRLLHKAGLTPTDRVLGMAFGVIRGLFIVVLFSVVFKVMGVSLNNYTENSQLYPKVEPLVTWAYGFTPNLMTRMNDLEKMSISGSIQKN